MLFATPQYIKKEIKIFDFELSRDINKVQNLIKTLAAARTTGNTFSPWKCITGDRISLSQIFNKNKPPNSTFVALVGASGSGKTTFAKQILEKYSKNKVFLGAEYLFYMQFSDIDLNYKSNLFQFLASTFPYQWLLNNKICANVLKQITESSKLCLIIDDFVTKNINFPNFVPPLSKSETICSGETHLVNILSGNALPGATIIVTFRPNQVLGLPNPLKPYLMVHILSLKEKNRKEISKCISFEQSTAILRYIQTYPQLNKFCVVPGNCFAVMHIIDAFCLSRNNCDPIVCFPLTQIFVASLALLFLDKGLKQSQCNLSCVVKHAWGFFSKENLNLHKEHCNGEHACQLFEMFLQLIHSKWFFSVYVVRFYTICQNFFIAVGLLYFNQENSKNLNDYLKNCLKRQILDPTQDSKEISKFLFGLCNNVTFIYMEQLLPSYNLLSNLPNILRNSVIDVFSDEKKDQLKKFSTLIFISSLAFEMQDDLFRKKLANTCFPDEIHVNDDCSPFEIVAFFYVLEGRATYCRVCDTLYFTGENKNCFLKIKQNFCEVFVKLV